MASEPFESEGFELEDAPTDPGLPAPRSPESAASENPAAEPPWQSLHPLSLVANLVPQAWNTARAAWPLLLALFVGSGSMGMEAVDLSLLFVFFGLTLMRTLVHFLTLRYRVHAGHFEVRSGLFTRQARRLDPTRIQNIERVQNLFHKAVGLVEVRVETAGDASTQGLLSALSVEDAAQLQADLERLVRGARPQPADPAAPNATEPTTTEEGASTGTTLVEGSALEAIAYGLSRRTVGTVAVLTAVFAEVFGRINPSPEATRQVLQPNVLGPAVLLAFAGSWGWSAGRALLRHWRFTLRKNGDRLINEEGLTTRRRVEIPVQKVQLVRADEPLMRRWMGYGSVLIETAALGFADGQVRQAEGVVPMVERAVLPEVVQAATPNVTINPWTADMKPAHWRALWRMVAAGFIRTSLFAGVAWWFAGMWGLLALLALPVVALGDWLEWRRERWLVTPISVVVRRGLLRQSTWVLDRAKIQSVVVVQSPMMRLHGLGRVVVRVAGNSVALPDVALDVALDVFHDLTTPSHTPNPAMEAA
jgi:putative membrane protein